MVRYLNTKLYGTTENLDQLDSNDFKSYKEFKQEMTRLKGEYNLTGGHGSPYWSQRNIKQ